MTGCAKMVCSSQPSPVLSCFTPPVAASLSKQSGRRFPLSTMPNQFCLHWRVPKYFCLPLVRSQSYTSLTPSPSMAEWKELPSEDASESRLILVDGKAIVYRAYYKISAKIFHGSLRKMTSQDLPENSSWDSIMTTVVALTEILNLLELQPSHAAVVFDFPGLTFRHSAFPEYKSHRLATPDTVRHSVRDTKYALLGMGVKVIEVPGVEADDVIGTLSLQAVETGMKVRVASQDKDFFQILSPQLRLLRFRTKGSGFLSFGVAEFNLRYPGLQTSQFVDMQALVGDVADNIPGVRGIGDVTARKLIIQYGTLENLLDLRNKIAQTRARNGLLEDDGQALLSKYLLLLKLNVPEFAIGCSLRNLNCREPEDGGKSFAGLMDAFGAIVGPEVGADLLERTLEYWRKLSESC
ncbi:unnamed protein product [Calypogeia fissa]